MARKMAMLMIPTKTVHIMDFVRQIVSNVGIVAKTASQLMPGSCPVLITTRFSKNKAVIRLSGMNAKNDWSQFGNLPKRTKTNGEIRGDQVTNPAVISTMT